MTCDVIKIIGFKDEFGTVDLGDLIPDKPSLTHTDHGPQSNVLYLAECQRCLRGAAICCSPIHARLKTLITCTSSSGWA